MACRKRIRNRCKLHRVNGLRWFHAWALCLTALLAAGGADAACPSGNLLLHRTPSSSRSTEHPERLSDGLFAREGDPTTMDTASAMKGLRPYVEWDLVETTRLVAATVQADNNDSCRSSLSESG